jgi:hypothetical protein
MRMMPYAFNPLLYHSKQHAEYKTDYAGTNDEFAQKSHSPQDSSGKRHVPGNTARSPLLPSLLKVHHNRYTLVAVRDHGKR